jgi:hypothetical protein
MAHAFKIISAKPTFSGLRTKAFSFQSDYINLKKARIASCNTVNKCSSSINYPFIPSNKTNLVAGLYSKMDLGHVCTLINGFPCNKIDSCAACSSAVSINSASTVAFNWTNTVDPVGALFGNTPCGTDNFVNYMKFDC